MRNIIIQSGFRKRSRIIPGFGLSFYPAIRPIWIWSNDYGGFSRSTYCI